ncbi:MAG: UDP-N-acetylmuramate dehydrogenase [Bacillota bacterium]|nr:UDP-N-acetylmuramate dehydrogenase [Bacillota bacterium]
MSELLLQRARELNLNVRFYRDEPMKNHTSFQIGGPADLLAVPNDRESLLKLTELAKDLGTRAFFLGNGSNVLVSDEGIEGLVIKTEEALNDISVSGEYVKAGSGVRLSRLSAFCRENSLTGLEFAQGIPGTVGGAVFMNAGAYGGEMSSVLYKSEYYKDKRLYTIDKKEHDFSYRHSFFSDRPDCLILSSVFKLTRGDADEISAKMADFSRRRKDKQPLNYPSAGSVFKRPEGYFAGKLIEEAGLRGFNVNGAQVSEKHAGFIINRGGAACSDVISLIDIIKKTVFEKFSVELTCEIRFIGRPMKGNEKAV